MSVAHQQTERHMPDMWGETETAARVIFCDLFLSFVCSHVFLLHAKP